MNCRISYVPWSYHLNNKYNCVQAQTGLEDDEEVGETSPLNVRADGGKFMEEFFDQVT